MNVKRIDAKLYKAIMMGFQYQINCELTPEQCKELVDFIDNPLEVEEVCEWWTNKNYPDDLMTKCKCIYYNADLKDYQFCPNCGKPIKYESEE